MFGFIYPLSSTTRLGELVEDLRLDAAEDEAVTSTRWAAAAPDDDGTPIAGTGDLSPPAPPPPPSTGSGCPLPTTPLPTAPSPPGTTTGLPPLLRGGERYGIQPLSAKRRRSSSVSTFSAGALGLAPAVECKNGHSWTFVDICGRIIRD